MGCILGNPQTGLARDHGPGDHPISGWLTDASLFTARRDGTYRVPATSPGRLTRTPHPGAAAAPRRITLQAYSR